VPAPFWRVPTIHFCVNVFIVISCRVWNYIKICDSQWFLVRILSEFYVCEGCSEVIARTRSVSGSTHDSWARGPVFESRLVQCFQGHADSRPQSNSHTFRLAKYVNYSHLHEKYLIMPLRHKHIKFCAVCCRKIEITSTLFLSCHVAPGVHMPYEYAMNHLSF
jgi:hypothetical protein